MKLERIDSFVNRLAAWMPYDGVVNQYWLHGTDKEFEANDIRRSNLSVYLRNMARISPQVVLIGEAPGYRGCRLTGIPFTSEYLLFGTKQLTILSNSWLAATSSYYLSTLSGVRKTRETEEAVKEATAAIIWEVLEQLNFYPLLWNAFPFHPHRSGSKNSNRSPSKNELAIGQMFLQELLDLFNLDAAAAVGRKAEWSLRGLNLDFTYIRHPSHGGKRDFEKGIRELAASIG